MPRPEPAEARDLLDMAGQQQVIDHVEHEQRLHGVIREALAAFGEAEVAEALGVTEEGAILFEPISMSGVASATVMAGS